MNKHKMILFILVLFSISTTVWSEWIGLVPGPVQDKNKAPEIIDVQPRAAGSEKSFTISITIPGFNADKKESAGTLYDHFWAGPSTVRQLSRLPLINRGPFL